MVKKGIVCLMLFMFMVPLQFARTQESKERNNIIVKCQQANCPKCKKGVLLPFSGYRAPGINARQFIVAIIFDGYKCTHCGYKFNWK